MWPLLSPDCYDLLLLITVIMSKKSMLVKLKFSDQLLTRFQTADEFSLFYRYMTCTCVVYCSGIDLSRWRELLNEKGTEANLDKFTQQVHGNHFIPNTVLVDCTADSGIASRYYDWLRKGIHVITPNKRANSGPLDQVL